MNLDNFEIGQKVVARFTNCGRKLEFTGEITGAMKRFWFVKSITSPYADTGEQPGRVYHIARLGSRTYSQNNCIVGVIS